MLVPPAVVTLTSTTPQPAESMTVIEVGVFAVIVAVRDPKWTAVAPDRFTPVMVTVVPPLVEPWLGLMGMRGSSHSDVFSEQRLGVPIHGRAEPAQADRSAHWQMGMCGGPSGRDDFSPVREACPRGLDGPSPIAADT